MELFLPYPSNLITSDQTGQFASNTALIASGALLYSWIIVGSGAGGGGISAAELAATGAKITSLSGYVGNISGYLDNRFSLTGSNLDSKINSLSGFSTSTFATIINLGTTGSNLYNIIIGLSGDAASRYATLINLTATGANLQGQINSINTAGYITTGLADLRFVHLAGDETISGIKTFRGPINIETFGGDGLVVNINGISGTYAGNTGAGNEVNIFQGQLKSIPNNVTVDWVSRVLSGEWLTNAAGVNPLNIVNFQRLTDTSGAIISQISASAAGVSQLNGKSGIVTLVGTGGITITTAGQQIIISGGASGAGGGSGITQSQLDSYSGYASGHFLDKLTATSQSVFSKVGFSKLLTLTGGTLYPEGAGSTYNAPDGAGDAAFTGQLSIDGEFISAGTFSGSSTVSVNGWDLVNRTFFLEDSVNSIVIDFGNQLLSGNWRIADTGIDPLSIVSLNRLNSASGLLETNLALTGSNLYNLTVNASGQYNTNFATVINLTQTGVTLGAKITSLSGFVGNVSGALQALIINNANNISGNLGLTGSNLYTLVTGLSGQANTNFATIANLTQTGATLGAKIDSLSGFVGNASGALQTLIVNNSTNLSGNLALTGSNLYLLVTGFSGQANINFATVANLTQTGVTLGAKIDSLSGFVGNSSGALQTLLINNSANLSGNLFTTGTLLSAVKITGSSVVNNVNFTGLGGTLVFTSGGFTFISGAAAGGGGGVTSIAGLAGAVTISGTGTISTNVISSQIYISGGGTKTIKTWGAVDNEPPASNYATFNTRNSHPLLSFDEIVQQASVFRGRVPESTNFLNGLTISAQWVAEASVTGTTISGTIGWDAAIERIVSGGQSLDVDGFGTAKTIVALSGYQNGITRTTSVNFTTGDLPAGFGAGDMFRLRIRRDVANDNSTGNAQLLQVDMTLQ